MRPCALPVWWKNTICTISKSRADGTTTAAPCAMYATGRAHVCAPVRASCRRVAAMALAFDVRMCHHEEAHIGAHLLASIPHGTFADTMHEDRDPIWNHMIANRPAMVDGCMTLPDRPGFGWELDEDFIQKYRVSYAG